MSKTIPTTFSQDFVAGNVKAAMKEAGAGSGDLWRVPVDQLHVLPGLNVRTKTDDYEAHVESITQSILAEGFYPDKPIGVFVDEQGQILVRDGHTRLEAVKRAIARGAQIETLPCVTAPRGTTMVDVTVGLVKSNTGRPLQPIEVAVVIKRLVGWGWDTRKVAERFDYTEPYVNDLLGLLEAPEATKQLVSAGKVAAGTAIKLAKKVGATEAAKVLAEVAKTTPDGKVSAKHLKKAASEGMALKPNETVKRKPTAKELMEIVKSVYTDPAYTKLDKKLIAQIDFFFGGEE